MLDYPAPLAMSGERQTKASQLEQAIRNDIMRGRLAPGSKLRLKDLASRYDAGAIPLREALSRLAASGFVLAQDQRGFQVMPVSADEIRDITRVRVHIEGEALRDSIAHGDIKWESRLISAHYRLERTPLAIVEEGVSQLNPEWEACHEEFHNTLISACSSPLLIEYSTMLRDQTARYRYLSMRYESERERDIPAEHRALLDAAMDRDPHAAVSQLELHYQRTTEWVLAQSISGLAS